MELASGMGFSPLLGTNSNYHLFFKDVKFFEDSFQKNLQKRISKSAGIQEWHQDGSTHCEEKIILRSTAEYGRRAVLVHQKGHSNFASKRLKGSCGGGNLFQQIGRERIPVLFGNSDQ
jgi:hypothetical protein